MHFKAARASTMNSKSALAHCNITRQPNRAIAPAMKGCLAPGPRYVVAKRRRFLSRSATTRAQHVRFRMSLESSALPTAYTHAPHHSNAIRASGRDGKTQWRRSARGFTRPPSSSCSTSTLSGKVMPSVELRTTINANSRVVGRSRAPR